MTKHCSALPLVRSPQGKFQTSTSNDISIRPIGLRGAYAETTIDDYHGPDPVRPAVGFVAGVTYPPQSQEPYGNEEDSRAKNDQYSHKREADRIREASFDEHELKKRGGTWYHQAPPRAPHQHFDPTVRTFDINAVATCAIANGRLSRTLADVFVNKLCNACATSPSYASATAKLPNKMKFDSYPLSTEAVRTAAIKIDLALVDARDQLRYRTTTTTQGEMNETVYSRQARANITLTHTYEIEMHEDFTSFARHILDEILAATT